MRNIRWTVLAVVEGDAEFALLNHLKAIYLPRNCGVHLKVKTAFGKGAAHVVDHAIKYGERLDFDRCLVVFDTDVDFTNEVVETAEKNNLVLIPCDPCLEGLLLKLHGDLRSRSSEQHKIEFERRFGGRVQEPGVLEQSFGINVFEAARDRESCIHKLINTFGVRRNR